MLMRLLSWILDTKVNLSIGQQFCFMGNNKDGSPVLWSPFRAPR